MPEHGAAAQTPTRQRPLLVSDPGKNNHALLQPIEEAIRRVLASEWYILGTEGAAFEEEFAATIGCRHAIGVNSGTDALRIALMASGIGPGDEVITVANAGEPTPMAICSVGATPRLVDVSPESFTLSVDAAAHAIGPRTKAILPVHLYGQPADMAALQQLAESTGLPIIEDACQAHGATYAGRRVGTIGDVGCFSFYPTKNLGAIGDGGMVVTNNDALAERIRLMRQYGWERRNWSALQGVNSRLDEVQAAVLRVKLPYLEQWTARRRAIAALYDTLLTPLAEAAGLQLPSEAPDRRHVYHLYVVRARRRDDLLQHLRAGGIMAGVHYPHPVHLQPAFVPLWSAPPVLPETERLSGEVLSLPMYPELTDDDVARVADVVRSFC